MEFSKVRTKIEKRDIKDFLYFYEDSLFFAEYVKFLFTCIIWGSNLKNVINNNNMYLAFK